jgi:hypothetical protein
LKCRYPAIVVFESLLILEKDKAKKNNSFKKDGSDFVVEISRLSMCILVITETNNPVNSILLQNKYGLKNVPLCISNKSSVFQLYDMVFKVIDNRKIHNSNEETNSEIFEDLQEVEFLVEPTTDNQKELVGGLKIETNKNTEDPLTMIWQNIIKKLEKLGQLHLSKFNDSTFDDFKSIILDCNDRIKLFKKDIAVAEADNIFDKYHYIRKIGNINNNINFLEENSSLNIVSGAQVTEEYLDKKVEIFSQKLSLFAHLPLSKKRSKVVIETFYPTIASLRKFISNFDLIEIKNLATEYSITSEKYRFSRLSHSYKTLEIIIEAIIFYLIDFIENEHEQYDEDNSITKTITSSQNTSSSFSDIEDITDSVVDSKRNSSISIEKNNYKENSNNTLTKKSLKFRYIKIIINYYYYY